MDPIMIEVDADEDQEDLMEGFFTDLDNLVESYREKGLMILMRD